MNKVFTGFVIFVLAAALALTLLEPSIRSYGDGLWYCFAVFTTVGFGDLVDVTLAGRILTVVPGLYGILAVAFIPGVLVSYFIEVSKMKAQQSVAEFLEKPERLPSLSKEELIQISENVKNRRNRI